MAFDFPNSPSEGATFSPAGGPTYVYHAPAWEIVPIGASADMRRNRVVNGAMQVSQENGDSNVASGGYPADQWFGYMTGGHSFRVPTPVFGYFIGIYVDTAQPSIAASAILDFRQRIEGLRVFDFLWGSASARQAILRFTAYSNVAGTYTAAIRGAGASPYSFLAPFTLPAATWTTFTVVVPGTAAGTWPVTADMGMEVGFCFAAGADLVGVAGWQSGNKYALPGSTNGAAAAGNVLYIAEVGLYLDASNSGVAPRWETPDEAEEILACLRYFEICSGGVIQGYAAAGTYMSSTYPFKVIKRVVPALSAVGWTSTGNATNQTAGGATYHAFNYSCSAVTTGSVYFLGLFTYASARM